MTDKDKTNKTCEKLLSDNNSSQQKQPRKITSIGIRKSELLMKQYNHWTFKIFFLFTVFLVTYAYSLDSTIRRTFQATATSSYAQHALLSTVNVIKAVAAAVSQPTYARLSDTFGRFEMCILAIIFYSIGTVIMSQAYDIYRYSGGAILYQIGYSGMILVVHVILADFSNLDWRLFYYYVAGLPFIINTWVAGNVAADSLKHYSWNYSIGIWAFIFPLAAVPFLGCMLMMMCKASRTEEWKSLRVEEKEINRWKSCKDNIFVQLFWRIDIVGILIIVCVLGFILVPLTIAGGVEDKWKQSSVIAPLVIGFVLIIPFVFWEIKFARYPVLPYALLRDRGVWSALVVSLMINLVYMMPNDYMYTVLVVAMRASIKAATRIDSLFDFVATIVGPLVGLVVVKFKRLKGFIIFGVMCWIISMGILLHFRGDNDGTISQKYVNGIIGGLCLMGFGAGFFTHGAYVSLQVCTNHEYMAVVISIYLACFNVGMALGSSVSGAVWTNTLYSKIIEEFKRANIDISLAEVAYSSPFEFIADYDWATPERIALVKAYSHTQKILCIIGLVLCFPLLFDTFLLRDHKLESIQSLETNEQQCGEQSVVVNKGDDDIIFKKLRSFFKQFNREIT